MIITADARYDRLEVIGTGGMATVWRARDTTLDRIVAMKRPHPAAPGSETHARFLRETRIAATVSHPNLVTIYDVGTDDEGPFLIMEFVDAPTLGEIEVPPHHVAAIGSQLASALAAVHAADVVHRDVKPANVLVLPSRSPGEPGFVKLTDFGIARSLREAELLTQSGVVHATPAYAAPEVLAGSEHSAAADVYSLGALLFELVTGGRRLSANGTQPLVTDPRWSPIIGPALATDPADRPAAAEMARQLEILATAASASVADVTTRLAPAPPPPTGSPRAAVSPSLAPAGSAAATPRTAVYSFPPSSSRRRPGTGAAVWVFSVLMLLVVGIIVLAAYAANRSQPADTTPGAADPVTDASTAASPPGDPGPEPVVPGADADAPGAPADGDVDVVADGADAPPNAEPTPLELSQFFFAQFVTGLPDDEIKGNKAERMVERLDEAVSAAISGDGDEAVDRFEDVAEEISKSIESAANREAAGALLADVAREVGIDPQTFLDELDDD